MDESRLVSLILQACIQQTYKGRNGGNSDTFSGGVRGEYIHTGGDHRHIRCKLMEYRWLQSHMNGIFTESKPHCSALLDQEGRQGIFGNAGPCGVGVTFGGVAEALCGSGEKISLRLHCRILTGAKKAADLQLTAVCGQYTQRTGGAHNV